MTDRFDKLAPRDLVATLRSLDRRFSRVEKGSRAPEVADRLDAIGPSGRSLTEVFALAARSCVFLANEIEKSLNHEEPIIAAAALDASERTFVDDRPLGLSTATNTIRTEAERIAERLEDASAGELSRSVSVAGGRTTNPLALGQEMARTTIGLLNEAERLLEDLA